MGCKNCGHGESWHKENVLHRDGWNSYWTTVWGICTHPECIPTLSEAGKCSKYNHYYNSSDDKATYWTPEQIRLNEELRKKQTPAIVVDKDFHEIFCKVMKEELDKDCNCYGTTSEIRSNSK